MCEIVASVEIWRWIWTGEIIEIFEEVALTDEVICS